MAHHNTQTLAGGSFGKVYREKYNDKWAAVKRVPVGLIHKEQLEREYKVYWWVWERGALLNGEVELSC